MCSEYFTLTCETIIETCKDNSLLANLLLLAWWSHFSHSRAAYGIKPIRCWSYNMHLRLRLSDRRQSRLFLASSRLSITPSTLWPATVRNVVPQLTRCKSHCVSVHCTKQKLYSLVCIGFQVFYGSCLSMGQGFGKSTLYRSQVKRELIE